KSKAKVCTLCSAGEAGIYSSYKPVVIIKVSPIRRTIIGLIRRISQVQRIIKDVLQAGIAIIERLAEFILKPCICSIHMRPLCKAYIRVYTYFSSSDYRGLGLN